MDRTPRSVRPARCRGRGRCWCRRRRAHVAQSQLQDAIGAGVVVASWCAGCHPYTRSRCRGGCWPVCGPRVELLTRRTGDALNLFGRPLATSSRIWSMPQTRVRMNSLSSQPFSKMCHRIPQTRATSCRDGSGHIHPHGPPCG